MYLQSSQMLSWPVYNYHLVQYESITDHLYMKTLADGYIISFKLNVLTSMQSPVLMGYCSTSWLLYERFSSCPPSANPVKGFLAY